MRQPRILHVAAGGIGQFALLQMKACLRETVEIADMVVVQVGEDDLLDRIHVDAEQAQRLDRIAQEGALALSRDLRLEAGVDDEGAAAAAGHPDEIIHWHRTVMRVAADEVIAAPRVTGGIADGKQLVVRFGHGVSFAPRREA
jgi:hypothetical protein